MNNPIKPLITVKNVSKHYIVSKNIFSPKTIIKAVDDVSFTINKGESLGLIGESGSGKTTIAALVLKLIKADVGKIIYKDTELSSLNENEMRTMRKELQIIFQHSQGTLDPKMTVEELLTEPLLLHKIVNSSATSKEVSRLLSLVGLSESDKSKFPYQMSGGQLQRVGIARAISTKPSFIICDEPVSALDVSIQSQILNLLKDLQQELDLTYLFISHNLKVVKHICDRVAVMYKGKLVEINNTKNILQEPSEEYTKQLVESML